MDKQIQGIIDLLIFEGGMGFEYLVYQGAGKCFAGFKQEDMQ